MRPYALVALTGLISFGVAAQVSGGAISGTVTNARHAAMPRSVVTLRSLATGVERMVTTDTAGSYTLPDVDPGNYELSIQAAGFVTEVRANLVVEVGVQVHTDVEMQTGDSKQVNRIALASSASGESRATGASLNAATVRNAPLNGRDWTQLASLEAGVTGIQTGGAQAQRGFGAAISVSGARPDQNSYRLDGISINDYSNGAPGSVLGSNLGVDAVEQFSVLGSNYPSSYGRTSGGVINAVTRSGTNAFHGNAYEFLRNSALDARNFFDGRIPPFKRNQFGGSAGGPIQRERTFFFADYEGLRQSLGVTHVDTVPSASARSGRLSTGSVTVDPGVARFLNAFLPPPNGSTLAGGDIGIFTFAGQQVTTENYFTAKIDHKFSTSDSLSGTYLYDNSKIVQPDAFGELLSNVVSRRQLLTLHEQHAVGARFFNAASFGFNRAVAIDGGVSQVINPRLTEPAFGFEPGQFVGIIKGVPGLTNFPGGPNASVPDTLSSTKNFFWNSFQWADDAFLTRGRHSLQFGFVLERMQDNLRAISTANGSFTFGSLADFLTNRPRNFQGLLPLPVPVFGIRETLFGVYVHDDIRISPSVNMSVGVRYETATVPSEVHDRLANLIHLTDSQPHLGTPLFHNPTRRNFEPRAGIAWKPGTDGRTVVRTGFGVFDVLPLPYEFTLSIPYAAPFSQQVYVEGPPPGSFPSGAYRQFSGSSTALRSAYAEQNPKRNYVMQWNVNLEREVVRSLTATLAYVGSRGVHQPFRVDNIDMVIPVSTPAGYLYPPAAISQTINPNFGRISGTLWQASSSYHALQAVISKRLSRGVQFRGAYTWSKSIDTLSATVADDAFPNGLMNPLFFDQRTSRGPSDFNVGQNLAVNLTWEVPAPRLHSVLGWALSGWQAGGIYKVSSGQPFTAILGGDPAGMKTDETAEPPNRVTGPACESLTNSGNPNHYIRTQCLTFPAPAGLRGNLGRNSAVGPGLVNLDFSLFKNNRIRKISEAFNVQLRAEFFNIFNHANFASPVDHLIVFDQAGRPDSSAGLITSTQTPAREIQFAVKLIW
ncbi:MAG: hypothetical protein C5B51_20535 [Terriglobia bacterium]|nr:MAG: hypothetical protein C5B51_20535 [Terriglobia bacterium]